MGATIITLAAQSESVGTTITVSDPVYEYLTELKEDKSHQTYDSALREVLRDGGHDI
jgi:hypothetical protein